MEKLDDFKYFLQLHNKLPIALLHLISEPVFEGIDGLPADLQARGTNRVNNSVTTTCPPPPSTWAMPVIGYCSLKRNLSQNTSAVLVRLLRVAESLQVPAGTLCEEAPSSTKTRPYHRCVLRKNPVLSDCESSNFQPSELPRKGNQTPPLS